MLSSDGAESQIDWVITECIPFCMICCDCCLMWLAGTIWVNCAIVASRFRLQNSNSDPSKPPSSSSLIHSNQKQLCMQICSVLKDTPVLFSCPFIHYCFVFIITTTTIIVIIMIISITAFIIIILLLLLFNRCDSSRCSKVSLWFFVVFRYCNASISSLHAILRS